MFRVSNEKAAEKIRCVLLLLAVTVLVALTPAGSMNAQAKALSAKTTDNKWPWKVIVTGDAETDYIAEVLCQQILKPKDSEITRARKIYLWGGAHFTRTGKGLSSKRVLVSINSKKDKAKIKAYRKTVKAMLKEGKASKRRSSAFGGSIASLKKAVYTQTGTCVDMARLSYVLLQHAGLKADVIANNRFEHDYSHAWNVVKVKGKWYYYDGRWTCRDFPGHGSWTYKMFLVSVKTAKNTYHLYTTIRQSPKIKKYLKMVSKKDCPHRLKG